MYTFEVRVIVEQDWLDDTYREAFYKGENNAYTNTFFRHIYKKAQHLVHKKVKL